jgi:hypothetical protein
LEATFHFLTPVICIEPAYAMRQLSGWRHMMMLSEIP